MSSFVPANITGARVSEKLDFSTVAPRVSVRVYETQTRGGENKEEEGSGCN